MTRLSPLALLLFASLPLMAGGYDVTHYDLKVEADFVELDVAIEARVRISDPDLVGVYSFGLTDAYRIVSVDSDASPVTHAWREGEITVEATSPQPDTLLTFKLAGRPGKSMDDPRDVITGESLYLLWSDRFYPITFDDWASMTTTVVLPPEFDVIAPGKRVSVVDRGSLREHRFESSAPIVSASVIAVRGWVRTERVIGGIRFVTLLDESSLHLREKIVETSSDVVHFYASVFGGYPFEEFAFVTIPGIYARRAFPGFIGYSPAYLAREMERTGHDAHETALLWWGYTSRGAGPGSFQWTEGFGDYAELLYDYERGFRIPPIFARFRGEYLARDPESEPHYTELRGGMQDVVHGRYPWLIHILRHRIGDEGLRRGMNLLFERYRHRTFTIDELVQTLEEGAGETLDWWRREWIDRRGYPTLRVSASTRREGDRWVTRVDLEQKGAVYSLPLDVRLDAGEPIARRVALDSEQGRIEIESPKEPRRLVIDPEGAILMKLEVGERGGLEISSGDPFATAEAARRE